MSELVMSVVVGFIVAALVWAYGARLLRIAGGFLVASGLVAVAGGLPADRVTVMVATGAAAWLAGQLLTRIQHGYWPSAILEGLATRSHRPARRRPARPASPPGPRRSAAGPACRRHR